MATKTLSVTRKTRCFEAEVAENYRTITVCATHTLEPNGYGDENEMTGKPAVIVSIGNSDRSMTVAMAKALVQALNEAIAMVDVAREVAA